MIFTIHFGGVNTPTTIFGNSTPLNGFKSLILPRFATCWVRIQPLECEVQVDPEEERMREAGFETNDALTALTAQTCASPPSCGVHHSLKPMLTPTGVGIVKDRVAARPKFSLIRILELLEVVCFCVCFLLCR